MRISSRCSICKEPNCRSKDVAMGTNANILKPIWSRPAWNIADVKSLARMGHVACSIQWYRGCAEVAHADHDKISMGKMLEQTGGKQWVQGHL